tara:strand:- start:1081 stop:1881 length:801 start_codon:yes stop_codon:yes gene_type:complete
VSHYQTLGVDKTATQSEIKKAYRKLSMQHHPDKGGDTKRFQEIADAYAVVGDESKRQQYDAMQDNPFAGFGNMGGMDGNFGDLFNQFFGQQRQPTKGEDVRIDLHISFEEAFHGCSKSFAVQGRETVLNLKAGVKTGQKFRLAGRGAPHRFNSQLPNGDMYVHVHVQMSADYIIDLQNDIHVEVTLPWYEIMLGTRMTINSMDGPLSITVPRNTKPGKVLRVRGKGWPNYQTQIRGNLLVKIIPIYPELNDTQLEYIKKVQESNDE